MMIEQMQAFVPQPGTRVENEKMERGGYWVSTVNIQVGQQESSRIEKARHKLHDNR